jgi:hypothetical protein
VVLIGTGGEKRMQINRLISLIGQPVSSREQMPNYVQGTKSKCRHYDVISSDLAFSYTILP